MRISVCKNPCEKICQVILTTSITYGREKSRRKVWKCHGRTKKTGCMNDVINEDELFRDLSKVQNVAWEGVDAMDADDFADVSKVLVYKDRVEVKRG